MTPEESIHFSKQMQKTIEGTRLKAPILFFGILAAMITLLPTASTKQKATIIGGLGVSYSAYYVAKKQQKNK